MRRITSGAWWSYHLIGLNLDTCQCESSETSSSSSKFTSNNYISDSSKQGSKIDERRKLSRSSKKVSVYPIISATSPSTLSSIPKDSNYDNSSSSASLPSSTFRSRKLTTSTSPYNHNVNSKNEKPQNENKSGFAPPVRKIMFAPELDNIDDPDIKPKSKQKHKPDALALPFPSEKVGAYTCHGLEPSEYLHLVDPLTSGDDLIGSTSLIENEAQAVDKITGISLVMQKINQDRGSVVSPYGKELNSALFAVYDGHGDGGERVSEFVMNEVVKRLFRHPEFEANIDNALKEVFLSIDRSLKCEPSIDSTFCGTTACIVLVRDNTLHISNIGDSRAILCRRAPTTSNQQQYTRSTLELTKDQSPDIPSEKQRIEKSGGYVSPSPEPGVSARVWINPTHTFLGLAMSRSIGDFFLKKSGVIADPVVSSLDLNCCNDCGSINSEPSNHLERRRSGGSLPYEDEFIVIASDGVWEYMNSEEVVEVVGKAFDEGLGASEACEKLIVTAAMKWKDTDYYYRDDITAIVIRVKGLFDNAGDGGNATNDKV